MSASEKYFMDTDDDGHWYIVPSYKRDSWNLWRELDDDDSRSWVAPDWVVRINTHPRWVEFGGDYIQASTHDL